MKAYRVTKKSDNGQVLSDVSQDQRLTLEFSRESHLSNPAKEARLVSNLERDPQLAGLVLDALLFSFHLRDEHISKKYPLKICSDFTGKYQLGFTRARRTLIVDRSIGYNINADLSQGATEAIFKSKLMATCFKCDPATTLSRISKFLEWQKRLMPNQSKGHLKLGQTFAVNFRRWVHYNPDTLDAAINWSIHTFEFGLREFNERINFENQTRDELKMATSDSSDLHKKLSDAEFRTRIARIQFQVPGWIGLHVFSYVFEKSERLKQQADLKVEIPSLVGGINYSHIVQEPGSALIKYKDMRSAYLQIKEAIIDQDRRARGEPVQKTFDFTFDD